MDIIDLHGLSVGDGVPKKPEALKALRLELFVTSDWATCLMLI
ncbi:MAG: hypothetical protein ACI8Z5_002370 [Lentimonas sp.]|jgi:hypothetical protein